MEYKRHKSRRSSNDQQHGGLGTALFAVLVIIILGVIIVLSPLGDYLYKNAILPVFSCVTEKNADRDIISALSQQEQEIPTQTPTATAPAEPKRETILVEETPFYLLQMGAFTDETAAAEHAEELRRMGAAGFVYEDGSAYRVFAAAYLDEGSLSKVQSQVRSDGFEATPFITDKKAAKLTLEGKESIVADVTKAAELLREIPIALCKACLSFDKQEMKEPDLMNLLNGMVADCETSERALYQLKADSIDDITKTLKIYRENISTFLAEHVTMNPEMFSGEFKYLQIQIILDYILFFDRK